jgi:hypothetical protein
MNVSLASLPYSHSHQVSAALAEKLDLSKFNEFKMQASATEGWWLANCGRAAQGACKWPRAQCGVSGLEREQAW